MKIKCREGVLHVYSSSHVKDIWFGDALIFMTLVLVFTRKLCHFLSSDLCLWYQIDMYSIFKCVLNECENVLKFIFQCCTCQCKWVLLSFENYISCQLCPKSCKFTENCNIFIIMVNINDFEQFTLGRVRLLLVTPSRNFFYSKYIAR